MSDVLWGVVIGGTIATVSALVILLTGNFFKYRRWKRQSKLEHLRTRKAEMKTAIMGVMGFVNNPKAYISLEEGVHITDLPAAVLDAIRDLIIKRDKQEGDLEAASDKVFQEISAALQHIDKEIEKLLS